ncbi:hypothetical protein [Brotaphodocola sp.]|uniref:hypothetical protein n=1 Tax=Brotaphodocola sp. TaxID=3073577 RepID=UPI003D7D0653
MKNIIVVEDKKLSKQYEKRFVVVDKETGEILDDAQGYGYKTIKNAYSAYAYKTRDKSKDKERLERKKYIQRWMKEHKDFVRLMDQVAFEIAKGSWGPDDKFDAKLVKQMLRDNELKTDFTAGELLRVWRNGI